MSELPNQMVVTLRFLVIVLHEFEAPISAVSGE